MCGGWSWYFAGYMFWRLSLYESPDKRGIKDNSKIIFLISQ